MCLLALEGGGGGGGGGRQLHSMCIKHGYSGKVRRDSGREELISSASKGLIEGSQRWKKTIDSCNY